jgi:sec-independent protein translocase protein TatA
MDVGPVEILVVLLVVAMIFGVGKLPEIGGAVGKSIREFRKASDEDESGPPLSEAKPEGRPYAGGAICPSCGAPNATDSKFCTTCGSAIGSPLPTGVACASCGASNAADFKFCTTCGSAIGSAPGA